MGSIVVRGIPDEVHRALKVRAKRNGRSTEAEIRQILKDVSYPEERIKLGDLLVSIAEEAGGLTNEEALIFETIRDRTPVEPMRFE